MNDVDAGYTLRDRMFHLETSVHLEEVKLTLSVHEKLHRSFAHSDTHTHTWWHGVVDSVDRRMNQITVTNSLLVLLVGCWISCSHSRTLLLAWSLEPEHSTASHL